MINTFVDRIVFWVNFFFQIFIYLVGNFDTICTRKYLYVNLDLLNNLYGWLKKIRYFLCYYNLIIHISFKSIYEYFLV